MKSNVCYNLNKSEYIVEYKGYKFYFSSLFNQQRFHSRLIDYIENEILKLNYKYRTTINAEIMVALSLYRKIEKRGFYVLNHSNCPISKNYEIVMEII